MARPSGGLRIGALAGAPILIEQNIVLLALVVGALAFIDGGVGALPGAASLLIALVLAVLLHELAHAYAALALRLRPARIVLNFLGGHVEFTVPPRFAWQDALVSFAGPAANLATWGLLALNAAKLGASPQWLENFWRDLAFVSLFLGLFNLLPGFPLDGGRIMAAGLSYFTGWLRARLFAAWTGIVIAVALIVFAVYFGMYLTIFVALLLGMAAFVEMRAAQAALAQGVANSNT